MSRGCGPCTSTVECRLLSAAHKCHKQQTWDGCFYHLRSRRARYVSQGAVMTPAWRFLLARLLVARVVVVEHGDDHDEGAARYG